MESWAGPLALFAVGCIAGALNVIAGGGSFLTLPVLIFAGLPPGIANATNRVGILTQNIGAVWSFDRHGVLDRRLLPWTALPALAGGAVGAWAALEVSDETFKRLLAFLMVAVTLWTIWNPLERARRRRQGGGDHRLLLVTGFFAVGIYGGFIQAGVGFFMLAVTTLTGLDMVRGNAIKVFCALAFTLVSLAIFIPAGRIAWVPGLSLAAGNFLGGLAGVHLTVLKGHGWVKGVVTVTVILFALRLWFGR